jgi:hypothetical protein
MRSCFDRLSHVRERFLAFLHAFASDPFLMTRAVRELRNTCGEVEALNEAAKANQEPDSQRKAAAFAR